MENSRTTAIMGVVIGGIAAYLFFTERGRAFRRELEPALDNFSRELMSCRDTLQKTARVAHEGWELVNDIFGEEGKALRAS